MNNFILKSANRLIKNSSINPVADLIYVSRQIGFVLSEQRAQRADLQEILTRLNKLMIDKHLQQQVDTYFEDAPDDHINDLD